MNPLLCSTRRGCRFGSASLRFSDPFLLADKIHGQFFSLLALRCDGQIANDLSANHLFLGDYVELDELILEILSFSSWFMTGIDHRSGLWCCSSAQSW
jgi:hypothetical protein